ncbi:MAG: Tol-Pal system beta propeller repeat protein TolB [Alphaproteobacteria bacterium]|nr:Tol-Pal system beta propeller repeat protein TolB [Alphaproteobacteria bacterium]
MRSANAVTRSIISQGINRMTLLAPLARAVALIAMMVVPSVVAAQTRIDITQGNFEPVPIAVTEFTGVDPNLGRQITAVVSADLERSGLFRPISPAAFIEKITSGDTIPRFADWRQINAQFIVTGSIAPAGDKLKVSFRLWDVLAEQQIAGKEFNTYANNWRRISHLIADEVYKRTTGEEGYFDTRIVYVAESGPGTKRVKRLAIMDQDGENHKFLTDGSVLVLTPRFSPNTQEILYLSYAGRQPRVFLRDLQTGREEMLGRFDGMSFAPRFNHDGSKMLFSIAKGGVTNIHEMDLRSRSTRQITNGGGIDTSPTYSPDGRMIAFNSDRGGSQQIYVMNADGSGIRRVSFGEGRYGDPVWSPRGDYIAFTKMYGGAFYIGVMKSDGSGERMLTQSWLDESPSWAPNGRVIVFSRGSKSYGGVSRSRLYSVDITGRNLREVMTPMDASDPAWSPLLPM